MEHDGWGTRAHTGPSWFPCTHLRPESPIGEQGSVVEEEVTGKDSLTLAISFSGQVGDPRQACKASIGTLTAFSNIFVQNVCNWLNYKWELIIKWIKDGGRFPEMCDKPLEMGWITMLFLLLWWLMTQLGTGGRVIRFEDDTKLGAMMRAFCRQTQDLITSQQLDGLNLAGYNLIGIN